MARKPVHIGCSGWSYKEWRGPLYPEKLPQSKWLARYAEQFSTVEINNTFYRLPTEKAAKGWVENTPDGFVFSVKVSRYLTHVKRLKGGPKYMKRFFEPLRPLLDSSREGPFLWQFPGNFQRNDERLAETLEHLPPHRHAFEFRHPSWFDPAVYELLGAHNAALVIGDHPERDFQTHELTADWTLIRLHHGTRGRGGNYSKAELEEWRRRIRRWSSKTEVFGYMNNEAGGHALENAISLNESLGG